MNHIKTGYLPTWWVFDSRAPKQDPSLAGIYAPLGPQIYASTRKGSKPCNPAASPVHVPRPQEGLHEALWRENCFWRNNPLIHSLVSGVLSAKHTLHSHKAWIWSHQLNSIFWLKRQSLSPNLYLWVPIEPFDLWRNHPHDDITGLVKDQLSLSSITQRAYHTEATFENNLSFRPIFCFSLQEPNDSNDSPVSSAATCRAASVCQLYRLPEVAHLPTRLWRFT